jgi:SAM-dependent methyltransferase
LITPYDQLEYRGGTFAQSHPQRLASVAALFGLHSANSQRCRVLELGCGNGANLIPMAFYSPHSQFVGIDLAHTPIDSGQIRIKRLGLKNIELKQADVATLGDELGSFDYVIAHGLYSWVPEAVRPHILRVISESLTDNGVAYVSYNALPGCRLRHLVRELLLFRFGKAAYDPARIAEVRSFLRDFSRVENTNHDAFMQLLKTEISFVCDSPDHVLFHDDLSIDSNAFYLHEFVHAANQFELSYLGEANLSEMFTMTGFDEFDAALERWAGSDWVAQEQYQDFTKGRRFRQTLLCRRSVKLNRQIDESCLRGFELRSALTAKTPEQALEPAAETVPEAALGSALFTREPMEFVLAQRTVSMDEPLAKLALTILAARFPDSISFAELNVESLTACQQAGLEYEPQASAAALSKLLWSLARAGLLDVLKEPVQIQQQILERPMLSGLILDGLANGQALVGALHASFKLDDDAAHQACLQLNGQNDRQALRAAAQTGNDGVAQIDAKFAALFDFLRRQGAFHSPH